jgi:hypothetical protein
MKTKQMNTTYRHPFSAVWSPEARAPWESSASIWRQLLILTAGLFFLFAASAGTIVSPGADASVEGGSNNGYPFDLSYFPGVSTMRYQQVFNSSEFSAAGGPMLITAIAFRPDSVYGAAFSATLSSVQINLSTTSVNASTLGSTFANNVGANDTVVFNGPLSLSSAFTGHAGGPKDFDIVITLTTPFVYNSASGNLLLDVRNFGGGYTTVFDSDASSTATQRVWAENVGDAAGINIGDTGLITQFRFTSVPEPQLVSLVGLALVAARRLRQSKR